MQHACIKVLMEYLEQDLHLQTTKNGCTETLKMNLYLYVLTVVMNYNRRAACKAIIKDVTGKGLSMGRKNVRIV